MQHIKFIKHIKIIKQIRDLSKRHTELNQIMSTTTDTQLVTVALQFVLNKLKEDSVMQIKMKFETN